MLKNYLKITFRNLWKTKGYSLLNITGLSIGMAAAILIILWIQNELGIECFHAKTDRIYAMYNRDVSGDGDVWAWNSTPKVMGPALMNDYPEVEASTRHTGSDFLFTVGEKKLNASGAFVDSTFLNIFTFPLLKGDVTNALDATYNIVLTASFAQSLFGMEDAMGKTVLIDSTHLFTVTGILKELPNNTLFNFKYLLPWSYMKVLDWDDKSWTNNSVRTYTLLKEGASQQAFDSKVKNITIDHSKNSSSPSTIEVFTQPLSRYYLYGKSSQGELVAGNIITVRLFSVLAGFILLIACINFMNLSTARSEKRAKEVGIRKVVGVNRSLLVTQFLGESIILSVLSFIIAILLVILSLPAFNQLVGKQLYIPFNDVYCWLYAVGFILLTGIIAGSYPAFYLSSFNPVKVLKGTYKQTKAIMTPRKILVTLQFTFAIILIIATIIISSQIQYGLNRDAGYKRDNLIYVFAEGDIIKNYNSIKNEVINSGAALSITQSGSPITQRWSDSWGFQWDGSNKEDEKTLFLRLGTDAEFIKTIGLDLIAGRDIDINRFATDSFAILLNETAVKSMRFKDPIGKTINWKGEATKYHVVGVIKDFIIESPFQQKIAPLMVAGPGAYYTNVVHLRMNPANSTTDNLKKLEDIFKKYNPNYPFNHVFTDDNYAQKFRSAERTGKLVGLFTGLTIFISCLGLFGLATYMAESRTKEIGIRKVVGASVFSITRLLSKEFLLLIVLSLLIASPIAWYVMTQWLDSYSYRIRIEWWVFVLTAIIAILITLLTVSFQSVKAAIANPVKSLRDE